MSLTETQKAFVKDKQFRLVMHLNCEDQGILSHRCEELKINRVVVTPKVNGRWGNGVATYTFDGCDKEFASISDLLIEMGIQ